MAQAQQTTGMDDLKALAALIGDDATDALGGIRSKAKLANPDRAALATDVQVLSDALAAAAEDPAKKNNPQVTAALKEVGGGTLANAFNRETPATRADLSKQFRTAIDSAIKDSYNIDLEGASPAASQGAPAAGGASKSAYQQTVDNLTAISPEAAKSFQAWAELDKQGGKGAEFDKAKQQLVDLVGGQVNEAIIKASKTKSPENTQILAAARSYLGEADVNALVRNPNDGGAKYRVATAARSKLISQNDPQPAAGKAVEEGELAGVSSDVKKLLPQIQAIAGADKTLLSLAQLNQENANADRHLADPQSGINKAITLAKDDQLNILATQMMAAEAKPGAAKDAADKFVHDQGISGAVTRDAVKDAARKVMSAGISGGQAQLEMPVAPKSVPQTPDAGRQVGG